MTHEQRELAQTVHRALYAVESENFGNMSVLQRQLALQDNDDEPLEFALTSFSGAFAEVLQSGAELPLSGAL
jgi:hypothetical protein